MAYRIYCDICGCEIKDEEDKIEIKYRKCNQSAFAFNKYYSVTTHTKCAEHAVKELGIVGVIEKYKR